MDTKQKSRQVITGIPEKHRTTAAHLYDEAFGQKIAVAIPDKSKRIQLFENYFNLSYALAAIQNDELIGIAGFTSAQGSLTSGIEYSNLLSELGILAGNRAALVLSLYERKATAGELLMDGIAVGSHYRGLGVGTELLSRLINYASTNNYTTVRLDVIDTNASAKNLYERVGFTSTKTENFEFLRSVLGFGAATTMIYSVRDNNS